MGNGISLLYCPLSILWNVCLSLHGERDAKDASRISRFGIDSHALFWCLYISPVFSYIHSSLFFSFTIHNWCVCLSVRNLFFWRVKTKTENDVWRVSSLVSLSISKMKSPNYKSQSMTKYKGFVGQSVLPLVTHLSWQIIAKCSLQAYESPLLVSYALACTHRHLNRHANTQISLSPSICDDVKEAPPKAAFLYLWM